MSANRKNPNASDTIAGPAKTRRHTEDLRLVAFAELLQDARREIRSRLGRNAAAQREIAAAVSKQLGRGRSVSQSQITQIEAGKVTNPDAALLGALSHVYGVSYETLVAAAITDKYGIPRFKSDFVAREIKSVVELAEWEKALPERSQLWIAAKHFADRDDDEIFRAVVSLLRKKCEIVYFVDEEDANAGGKFAQFQELLQADSTLPRVRVIPLSRAELLRVSAGDETSIVIANPFAVLEGELKAVGYRVVNRDGKPDYGERMTVTDTLRHISKLRPIYTDPKDHLSDSTSNKTVPLRKGA